MTLIELGIYSFPVLLLLIFLRAPIGLAMVVVGLGGLVIATGDADMALNKMKTEVYTRFSNYNLSIIPVFLLMGQFATLSGMSSALFRAGESWLGHLRGGVAMASVGSCAGFGAICGSSLATAATMSRVALPELRRYGYSGGFSTATLAAGGTLGILIPPSVILVIYAILTEQNIEKLFLAAFVPGILAAIGYMITISIYVRLSPDSAGVREPVPWADRFRSLVDVWPVVLIFGLVVGGIYWGWFNPTEGASIGAAGTGLLALWSGNMNWKVFRDSLISTATSTAMIFFIVMGADFYNGFLALTQAPQELANWIVGGGFNPWWVLIMILVFYLIFGCLMDSLSMILLTIPIFWPVIEQLDFGLLTMAEYQLQHLNIAIREGLEATPELIRAAQESLANGVELTREQFRELGMRPVSSLRYEGAVETMTAVWFGILVLIVVEVGLITPPVGMNLFIINAMDRSTPMWETYKAVIWFVLSDLVRVAILVAFPIISLFLITG